MKKYKYLLLIGFVIIGAGILWASSIKDVDAYQVPSIQETKNQETQTTCSSGHLNCDGNHSTQCSLGHTDCDGDHSTQCALGHTNCDGNHSSQCALGHTNCNGQHRQSQKHHSSQKNHHQHH